MPESGEDSEDEWNYIKVEKKDTEVEKEKPSTPEPVTAETEQESIQVEESHAISQALAESQEACTDVNKMTIFFEFTFINFFVSAFAE